VVIETLGLIAGDGRFPAEIARAARARGSRVVAVGFRGLSDPALGSDVDALHWLHLGEVEKLLAVFAEAGARDLVMAGKVSKEHLYRDRAELRPDRRALEILSALRDQGDDAVLGALAAVLEAEGLRLHSQAELAPGLVAGCGALGACSPSATQLEGMAFGWPIAKAIGGLGIGQTVVVEKGSVLAVEAIEGTDAAIRRGGKLGTGSACVVKVARPGQDLRFDLPAIGLGTVEAMLEAKLSALAFEAGRSVILDRAELTARADDNEIVLVGFGPDGPCLGGQSAGGSAPEGDER
jgi:DUF1009 family protein